MDDQNLSDGEYKLRKLIIDAVLYKLMNTKSKFVIYDLLDEISPLDNKEGIPARNAMFYSIKSLIKEGTIIVDYFDNIDSVEVVYED